MHTQLELMGNRYFLNYIRTIFMSFKSMVTFFSNRHKKIAEDPTKNPEICIWMMNDSTHDHWTMFNEHLNIFSNLTIQIVIYLGRNPEFVSKTMLAPSKLFIYLCVCAKNRYDKFFNFISLHSSGLMWDCLVSKQDYFIHLWLTSQFRWLRWIWKFVWKAINLSWR